MIRLALRNLRRHRGRTIAALTALAVTGIGVVFVGSYFAATLFGMRESYIEAHTGHLQIHAAGYLANKATEPLAHLIDDAEGVRAAIAGIPGVRSVRGQLEFAGLLSNGRTSFPCHVEAVDLDAPGIETGVVPLHTMLRGGMLVQEGQLFNRDAGAETMLGFGAAAALSAHVGSPLTLSAVTAAGGFNAQDLIVRGVFQTSAKFYDDHVIRIPLRLAQELQGVSSLQTLVVFLNRTDDTELVGRRIAAMAVERKWNFEIRDWQSLNDFYTKTRELFLTVFAVLNALLVVAMGLVIVVPIQMGLIERTPELGVLRALGTSRGELLRVLLLEGLLLGIVGGLIGIACGMAVTFTAAHIGISMPPPPGGTMGYTIRPQINAVSVFQALTLTTLTSVVASFYPSYRASRLSVADALRSGA